LSKKTLEACKKGHLTPIFQVKLNQKELLQNIKHIVQFSQPITTIISQPQKAHGRIEIRENRTFVPNKKKGELGYITDEFWRKHVKVIIEVTRITKNKNTKQSTKEKPFFTTTTEKSYYFTTTATLSSKELETLIREHWSIENKNHYVRDVTLSEDKSRIRKNPMIMAIIRSTALNTIRHQQPIHNYNIYQNIQQQINTNKWSSTFFEDYSWLWRSG
jgi:predicted transposase YbfD/YdcC